MHWVNNVKVIILCLLKSSRVVKQSALWLFCFRYQVLLTSLQMLYSHTDIIDLTVQITFRRTRPTEHCTEKYNHQCSRGKYNCTTSIPDVLNEWHNPWKRLPAKSGEYVLSSKSIYSWTLEHSPCATYWPQNRKLTWGTVEDPRSVHTTADTDWNFCIL